MLDRIGNLIFTMIPDLLNYEWFLAIMGVGSFLAVILFFKSLIME